MNLEKYKNKLTRPKLPERSCPDCKSGFGVQDSYCSQCGKNIKKYWEEATATHSQRMQTYNEHSDALLTNFQKDVLEDVGLLGHRNAQRIYEFAWAHGHSAGLHEVYYWLLELSELFEEEE